MSIAQHFVPDGHRLRCVILALLTVISLWPLQAASVLADDNVKVGSLHTIVLGRVSNNPRKHYAALDALGRYLVENLDDIDRHETLLARDNDEMIEFLRSGKVDLVSESAFSAVLYEQVAGAKIFLRQWKGGRASYRALFFTREDSGIHQIEDLAGHLIAFEDSGSTSGYFVPRATIADHGLTLKFVDQPRKADDVGYLFADSEVNVIGWVARDKVDVGVMSDINWDDESRAPSGLKKDLRVFHTTPEIVRSVMVAGSGVDEKRLGKIVGVLLGMHENDAGQDVLKKFYKTTRFDRLVDDAKASVDHVRLLLGRLGDAPPS
ncbi:MAG: phosphate/phosphite/phosphonate ABC transporter substrate-binding protein [Geminicoccaceae bacterium]